MEDAGNFNMVTQPDIRRLLFDRRMIDMDNYIAMMYTTPKEDMFPIMSKIVTREEWGAAPAKKRREQKLPVQHMVITWTYTAPCETKEECIKAVKEIQKDHIERGANDIEYNFLIGGDGTIYEGRGWKYATHYPREITPDINKDLFKNNSIQVAFINKPSRKPTYNMLKAIATIFAIGASDNYLVKDVKYSRIAYNEVISFTF